MLWVVIFVVGSFFIAVLFRGDGDDAEAVGTFLIGEKSDE
jgi:hypothetical protein